MENNKILKILFSKNIYLKEAIIDSIAAYENLADFEIKDEPRVFSVRIFNINPAFKKIIADEFSNHVLGETQRCS